MLHQLLPDPEGVGPGPAVIYQLPELLQALSIPWALSCKKVTNANNKGGGTGHPTGDSSCGHPAPGHSEVGWM